MAETDTLEGTVEDVFAVTSGSVLTADAAAGDAVIYVDDASDFDDIKGGTLYLGGNTYAYTVTDPDTGELSVPDTLSADASNGDRVDVWDDAEGTVVSVLYAHVALSGTDAGDEPITAVLDDALALTTDEGIREPDAGEPVKLTQHADGEWTASSSQRKKKVKAAAGGSVVVTGDSSGSNSTSISRTVTGDGDSVASGDSNLVLGARAESNGAPLSAVLLGPDGLIDTSGNRGVGVGPGVYVNIDYGSAFGANGTVKGYSGLAAGAGSFVNTGADYGSAVSPNTRVDHAGGGAFGCDSSGNGASPDNDNELAIGTANHITVIKGKLVIADSSGGLHQIVVSTGGALSTVAYP